MMAQDERARQLTATLVRRQPMSSRTFARLLSETAAFKAFVDEIAQPREHWPRWLRFFEAHARHASEAAEDSLLY